MRDEKIEEHDLGLAHDLKVIEQRRMGRRQALSLFASAGTVALLAGCGGNSSSDSTGDVISTTTPTPTPTPIPTPTPTPTPTSCSAAATETNGPYPADGTNTSSGVTSNALTVSGVIRSDIRSSFVGSSTTQAPGVLFTVTLTLVNVNSSCAPLAGYAVYLWHCDRNGQYSLYDLPAESYLRGVQVTDANGQVTFTTIFPGCYAGRYPHMHFEVFSSISNATSGRYAVLISQLAMPSATCTTVYSSATGYSSSASRFAQTSIASDNVFGDNSTSQMAAMTPTVTGDISSGLTGTVTVGIAT